MGILRNIGSLAGEVAGDIIGGTVNIVGQTVKSEYICEIGKCAAHVTKKTGDRIGTLAEGAAECISGAADGDNRKTHSGTSKIAGVAAETAEDTVRGVKNTAVKTMETFNSCCEGDTDKIKKNVSELAKIAIVGAVSFSIVDIMDIADHEVHDHGDSAESVHGHVHHEHTTENERHPDSHAETSVRSEDHADSSSHSFSENENTHHVDPHYRTLHNGTTIWVDGDGNANVDSHEGWTQHNPDFRKS